MEMHFQLYRFLVHMTINSRIHCTQFRLGLIFMLLDTAGFSTGSCTYVATNNVGFLRWYIFGFALAIAALYVCSYMLDHPWQ